MLLDTVVQSFRRFQTDCQALCLQHYPAVHNGGLTSRHLSAAFSRRLKSDFEQHALDVSIAALDDENNSQLRGAYRVTTSYGTVWVLAYHFVNGNQTSREHVFSLVQEWMAEYQYAVQKRDLLVVLADHWLSRCHQSRALINWWSDTLPDDDTLYLKQGVKLLGSDTSMSQELSQRCQLYPSYVTFLHPLTKPCSGDRVLKYVQLYAVSAL
ncbi:hypothetical protein [Vibrio sp. 10N]|uniref:hypothetical protein n=1 Tax=Vibrio sp. 10N TaxID=3058938 RepID=UPI00281420D7|nr:hypothetical protein VB10N_37840 [Vibrio sp. 10N]